MSRSTQRFFAPTATETVDVADGTVTLPIRYHRTDCWLTLFSADADAVTALVPSSRLHPVRLSRGRVAVGIMAYNYIQTGVGPYGEIGIALMCTLDRSAPPMLPLLRESGDPTFGAFVCHLPVTTRIARDAGRRVWGYPKFVADMDFELSPEARTVTLAEGGHEILRVSARRQGRLVRDDKPLVTFTEHDGEIIRTVIETRAVYELGLGRHAGHLELGDHVIADELRSLDISTDTVATKNYLAHAAILPRGRPIGTSDRPYVGYAGTDAACGEHRVRYDDITEVLVTESDRSAGSAVSTPTPHALEVS